MNNVYKWKYGKIYGRKWQILYVGTYTKYIKTVVPPSFAGKFDHFSNWYSKLDHNSFILNQRFRLGALFFILANMALLQINQRYVTTEEFELIFDQLWTLNQKFRTLFLYEKGLWWMCHLINIKCVNESFTYKLIAWNLYENFDLFIVFVKYENSNANYFQKKH